MTGFLQPIPSCRPDVLAAVEEAAALDSSIPPPPQRTQVIAFYKPWDPYGALSNFFPHPISLPDESGALVSWNSVKHYYQVLCGKMYMLGTWLYTNRWTMYPGCTFCHMSWLRIIMRSSQFEAFNCVLYGLWQQFALAGSKPGVATPG
jgi:hypothetical protein